jgi:DNA-binding transcriptional LysR family regulator
MSYTNRHINLRQIEAFKAVIEQGTVSAAADALLISQPAVSKLLTHLERDSGLRLFERVKGKLTPTARGMRLYSEIDRVFAGLRQVEHAIESIHRDEQKQLSIGVLPALCGSFINRIVMEFREIHPDATVKVHSRDSASIANWLGTQQLDVGLISSVVDSPLIERVSLIERPLICALPLGHHLASKTTVDVQDLEGEDFVSFMEGTPTRQHVDEMLQRNSVRPHVVMEASMAPTVGEAVSAGIGISLVHPLFIDSVRDRIAVRQFTPTTLFSFQLCRNRGTRNVQLVDDFLRAARRISEATLPPAPTTRPTKRPSIKKR